MSYVVPMGREATSYPLRVTVMVQKAMGTTGQGVGYWHSDPRGAPGSATVASFVK